ncbi:MAG: sigma-70 family RNA polymerase sigma factor [Caldilineales bacterium]|nr:sigma-70 family RNA polymerase sigma factor [Caldilineales bacterium]
MGPALNFNRLDDESLLRQIAHGNSDALGELYDRYARLVFSVAFNAVSDTRIAEEIAQEVFLQVWRNAGSYSADKAKVATWLTSMTRYRSIDRLRRRTARKLDELLPWSDAHDLAETDAEPEMLVTLKLQQERVRSAMETLPFEQQRVLGLAYFQGYSQTEIATLLELPLGTVKTRIRLGMEKLRKLLVDEAPDQIQ